MILRFVFFIITISLVSSIYSMDLIRDVGYFPGQTPDLVVLSKFDHSTSKFIVDKIRKFLTNNNINDPFGNPQEQDMTVFKDRIVIEENIFSGRQASLATKNIKTGLLDLFQNVSKDLLKRKDLDRLRLRIEIRNLGQKIKSLSSHISPSMRTDGSLDIDANFRISDIKVEAEMIKVALRKPVERNGIVYYDNILEFTLNSPIMETPSGKGLGFDLVLNTYPKKSSYGFKFIESSFSDLQVFIKENSKEIILKGEWGISPSPFPLLRWGDKVWILCVNPKKVQQEIGDKLPQFLHESFGVMETRVDKIDISWIDFDKYTATYLNDFKLLLLEQIYQTISESAGTYIKKQVEQFDLNRQFWIPTVNDMLDYPLFARFNIENIVSNDYENVMVTMSGDLCTPAEIKEHGIACADIEENYHPVRKVKNDQFVRSLIDMQAGLINGESDLIVSVSEDYLTRLVKKTYQAGLWDENFKEYDIALNDANPNNMFVIAEKKGDTSSLYMDIYYSNLSFIERLMVGKKKIRIPLKFDVKIHIEKRNGVPYLIFTLKDVDSSKDFLLNGRRDFNLPGVSLKRFKRSFFKEAKKVLNEAVGTEIEIEIPELRDMSLETVVFKSNGKGRVLAKLSINEDSPDWIPNFFFGKKSFPFFR